jgi:hypothetical protein
MRSLAALALLVSACVVVPDQRPPGELPPPEALPPPPPVQPAPPPPAPPPRLMSAREALDRAGAFCRERGYDCRRADVEQLGGFWRVRFEAASADRQGLLYLDYDATSRALVRVDEPPVRPPPPPPVVVAPPPPVYVPRPAPAYPPAPQPMTRDEAVARGLQACRDRDFACDLVAVARQGDIWLVEFNARRGYLRGPLHVGLDAWTRDLVALDEPRPAPPPVVIPAPPPPPPAPRPMSFDEASRRGVEVCRERGYDCRLVEAALTGNLWRIRLDAFRARTSGRMYLELDAYNRAVVRLEEPRPIEAPPPPRPAPPPPAPPPPPPPPPRPVPPPMPPRPAPAPLPAPPPVAMRGDEAARFGLEYCRTRGWSCAVREQEQVRDGRAWKIRLEAQPPWRGHVLLVVDAFTRNLVEARDEVRRRGEHDRD